VVPFSETGEFIASLILGWPGVLLGLLVSVELLERSVGRRLLCSTRSKIVLAAAILLLGALTAHVDLSMPGETALQRAQEVRERQTREAAAEAARDQRQHDTESDQRLKSEVESLRQELANERARGR
jgi:hypothetical protein